MAPERCGKHERQNKWERLAVTIWCHAEDQRTEANRHTADTLPKTRPRHVVTAINYIMFTGFFRK